MPFFEEPEFDDPPEAEAAPGIDFRAALNNDQYAAVTAPPGPALVLAGAGSGKTRTLTYRVAYLLHQGVPPDRILLLTFTNKAAREMLERVEDLTGVERYRFWGGTFHSIGHRILRSHGSLVGLESNFTLMDEGDAEAFLRDVVERRDPGFFKDKTRPKPGQLGDIISLARNTRCDISAIVEDNYPQHTELIDKIELFARCYAEEKLRRQVTDYDDFLEHWLNILEKHPEVANYYRNRFEHILVDEYQDTNLLQAMIVDQMAAGHRSVMAVGDDAQCIYSWRGANFENFSTFPDRYPGTQIHRIEINYRSTPQILELANGILQHQVEKRGFEKTLRAQKRNGQKPCLVQPIDGREQAWFIAQRIRGLQSEGRSLGDIAVLYRAHYHAVDLQLELQRAGIEFQITSGVRFFETAHIRDVVGILRFINNPADTAAWRRIVTLLPKVGDKGAAKLHEIATDIARSQQLNLCNALFSDKVISKVPASAKSEWDSFARSLKDLSDSRDQAPAEIVTLAIDGWYGDYVRGAYDNYHNRLDDLNALVGFAGRYDNLSDMLAEVTLLASESGDKGTDSREDAVRLSTVHQSKGLEFDVVFVIGLADNLFPLKRAIEMGDVEEERRLFYVAVTRAREELYLCAPKMTDRPPSMLQPSRFIQEIDPSLYEVLRLPRRAW
jgi:DNA helicase-2/ATP-dependent DNA helicase PcrA